jgi:hypothetical protein
MAAGASVGFLCVDAVNRMNDQLRSLRHSGTSTNLGRSHALHGTLESDSSRKDVKPVNESTGRPTLDDPLLFGRTFCYCLPIDGLDCFSRIMEREAGGLMRRTSWCSIRLKLAMQNMELEKGERKM